MTIKRIAELSRIKPPITEMITSGPMREIRGSV